MNFQSDHMKSYFPLNTENVVKNRVASDKTDYLRQEEEGVEVSVSFVHNRRARQFS